MIFEKIVRAFVPSKQERDVKKLQPIVDQINALEPDFIKLSDEELKNKTTEFRNRIQEGESLDDLLPEAFAAVREAGKRVHGMRHFDVQLMGGIVLHQGKIAEMATGEGKTLVATLPMYLNALSGYGAHLVTVNDYLAKRDRDWMGPIYEFLGLTVGVLQNNMRPAERKIQYACDITYGTNSEFGFDYLRDNMTLRLEDQVQRGYNFVIVDEVDSILIDEARTPLIISGPVEVSTHKFDEMKKPVERLNNAQMQLVNRLVSEAEQLMADGKEYEAATKLLTVRRGSPKHKRLMKMEKEPGVLRAIERVELDFTRDKKMFELDEELFYSIDEKTHVVDLTEKGRHFLSDKDPMMFVLPDFDYEKRKIDQDESIPVEERAKKKKAFEQAFIEKSERLQNIAQLLKAFSLYEKDVDYVVKDGKVMIVDEFTGRLMEGRRFSDGLHEALEAKENVTIERETQTLATITIQNYFRMYEKLSGMTGTAVNNAQEFWNVYGLDVVEVPTNKPMIRMDHNDQVYKTKKEKYNAIIDEISETHKTGQPVLVGTISVDVSETIGRMLRMRGIRNYNILNAKQHDREAEIVRLAGEKDSITIATNMAGRGTDIKLGEGVSGLGGLHIIGTERHEAGRIDRQLRGRSGRQGDPGSSRFFLSLEDDLMRLFGSDRIINIMDKLGVEEGQVIEAGMVTKSIATAQKRVEEHNFTIRKQLLEYDDLMNKQRELIYQLRQQLLQGTDISNWIMDVMVPGFTERHDNETEESAEKGTTLKDFILAIYEEALDYHIDEALPTNMPRTDWDYVGLMDWYHSVLPMGLTLKDIKNETYTQKDIFDKLYQSVVDAYKGREEEFTPEMMRFLEKAVVLRIVDTQWRDHLLNMDMMKEGVGLRAFGASIENAALIEYKKEGHFLFTEMIGKIKSEIRNLIFKVVPVVQQPVVPQENQQSPAPQKPMMPPNKPASKLPDSMAHKDKIGRNDPCPCGSGKKYKKCCGANLF
jgi:preprotein translocase subunit SecA